MLLSVTKNLLKIYRASRNSENSEVLSKECNVKRIQITIDGPKRIHDKRRPHKDGPSYDIIMNNIKNNAHLFDTVIIRINVDTKNKPFLSELFDELKDMPENIRPYLAPVRIDNVKSAGFGKICYDSKDFGLEVESQKEFSKFSVYPVSRYGICGAVIENTFCIDPDGYLYKCWFEFGTRNRSIGSVVEGITNYERYYKWLTFDPTDYPDCKECNILPICNAGQCPYRVLFPEENGRGKQCSDDKWILEKKLVSYIENIENLK